LSTQLGTQYGEPMEKPGGDQVLAYRWVSAADMVSFDLTRSLLPMLGLGFAPADALANAMRTALEREWALEEADPAVWLQFPALCKSVLVEQLGQPLADDYERWLMECYGFVAGQLPQWFALNTAFIHFARNPKQFGLPRPATESISELYDSIMDLKDVENALDSRRVTALSDWDVALLARRGRHLNREGDQLWDAGDILAPIKRIALNQRLQAFCRRVVAALSPADLDLLDARIAHWGESRGFDPEGGFVKLAKLVSGLPPWGVDRPEEAT
jgi:hypothetical protein